MRSQTARPALVSKSATSVHLGARPESVWPRIEPPEAPRVLATIRTSRKQLKRSRRLSRCSWNFEVTAVPPARRLRLGV
jgi:hypothetical protein